jgi:UDP-N-acetylmuramoylalanine--D-glutamate ligase
VLLGGNIGVPLFDLIPKIKSKTFIVAELSCHQLNGIAHSPHIAVLLNLYEEHLDYYKTAEKYFTSKLSIFKNQKKDDLLIYNYDDARIKMYLKNSAAQQNKVSYSLKSKKASLHLEKDCVLTSLLRGNPFIVESRLLGRFNHYNILPAIGVAASLKLKKQAIIDGITSYKPLPHRLQYLGKVNDIRFVNDSISTIPQATIAAVKALKKVGSLIIGGYDRKINYESLLAFLPTQKIKHIVFFDKAGKRIYKELKTENPNFLLRTNSILTSDFEKAVQFCLDSRNLLFDVTSCFELWYFQKF